MLLRGRISIAISYQMQFSLYFPLYYIVLHFIILQYKLHGFFVSTLFDVNINK